MSIGVTCGDSVNRCYMNRDGGNRFYLKRQFYSFLREETVSIGVT